MCAFVKFKSIALAGAVTLIAASSAYAADTKSVTPTFMDQQASPAVVPPPPARMPFKAGDNAEAKGKNPFVRAGVAKDDQKNLPKDVTSASTPLPEDLGDIDPKTLAEISKRKTSIQLKELEFEEKTLDAKIAGVEAKAKQAKESETKPSKDAPAPGTFTTGLPMPVQASPLPAPKPVDDISLLPTVKAVSGAAGKMRADVEFPGGYSMNVREGDPIPGGFSISSIEGKIVKATSDSTGNEYALTYGNPMMQGLKLGASSSARTGAGRAPAPSIPLPLPGAGK